MGKTLVLNSRIMIIETKNDPTNQEINHNLNKFKHRSFPSPRLTLSALILLTV